MMKENQNGKGPWGARWVILTLLVSFLVGGWSLRFAAASDYPTQPGLWFAPSKPGSGPSMPAYAVKYWQGTLAKMVKTPTWQEMMTRYCWGDPLLVDGLGKFLDSRQAVVTEVATRQGMGKKK